MTREEQLEEAGMNYAEEVVLQVDPNTDLPMFRRCTQQHFSGNDLEEAFDAGAQWADRLSTAIRQVLEKRMKILREKVIPNRWDKKDKAYYQGKYDAYEQAIVLLGESLESIRVELEM